MTDDHTPDDPSIDADGSDRAVGDQPTSDAGGAVPSLTRRNALATLGSVGVGATGGFLLTGSEPVSAATIGNRPITALPGLSTHSSESEYDTSTAEADRKQTVTHRGVQMTNFRIVRDEDVVERACDGATGLEYRFTAAGLAAGVVRKNVDSDNEFLEQPGGDLVQECDLLTVDPVENSCESAAVQPHHSRVFTGELAPRTWFEAPDEVPLNEAQARRQAWDLLDTSTEVDLALGIAGVYGDFGNPSLIQKSASDLGTFGSGLKVAQTLLDVGAPPSPVSQSEYSRAGITLSGGNAPIVGYFTDFTVVVPADATEPTELDVTHLFDWATSSRFHRETIPDSVRTRIVVPPNDEDETLASFRLPEITMSAVNESEGGGLAVEPDTWNPDVGDSVSFDTAVSNVDSYDWSIDGRERSGASVENLFDAAGEYPVVLSTRSAVPSSEVLYETSSHAVTLPVGPDLHLRPDAVIDYSPRPATPGDSVTVDGSSSSSALSSVESYSWEVRTYTADGRNVATNTYDGPSVTLSQELSTEIEYGVTLTVTDARGNSDVETVRIVPRLTPDAAIDVGPLPAAVGDTLTLDGSGSSPRSGSIQEYAWTVGVIGDDGATVVAEPTGETVDYTLDDDAPHNVSLTVTNSEGHSDTVEQTVEPGGAPPRLPDGSQPQDVDGDGLYQDLNGNGRKDFNDIVVYFQNMDEPAIRDYPNAYSYNDNDRIDFDDVVTLFKSM